MTVLAVPAPAQDTAARVTVSLTAIAAGDNNDARREAIIAQLRALSIEPAVERFGNPGPAGANVIVTLPGRGTKTFVVGAHLDRVSVGRGAVDNGAACAALIELVAAFRATPLERATLQVVFFDREEGGLFGSRAFFALTAQQPDYAVNLDIFAYGDTIFATTSRPEGALIRALRAAGEATGLPVRDVPRASYPSSDHLTMMDAGIEALGVGLVDNTDVDGVLAIGAANMKAGSGPRILRIIHSPNDTLKEVRVEQMLRGIALVERLIRSVDAAD